uniref:Uncharacterized protein n=1 Tax=Romanomermis culicivorax TaxID=13658 RepID=A0A915JNN4_ROMCU
MLYYPDDKHWQVCEHKPLFVWHQTLSNLGGTLSIWTGASVLFFLHLLEPLTSCLGSSRPKNHIFRYS